MKVRYIISLAIGILLGLSMIIACGINGGSGTNGWQIPIWDGSRNFIDSKVLALEHKAVFLRICANFMEGGYWYLAIPSLITCAIAKIDQLGDRNQFCWCLSKSAIIANGIVLIFCFAWGFLNPYIDLPPPSTSLEADLIAGLGTSFLIFMLAWITRIAPALWFILFLILLSWNKWGYRTSPANT